LKEKTYIEIWKLYTLTLILRKTNNVYTLEKSTYPKKLVGEHEKTKRQGTHILIVAPITIALVFISQIDEILYVIICIFQTSLFNTLSPFWRSPID